LNKRFNNKIHKDHTLDDYINVLNIFDNCQNNPPDNVYLIKYEELFQNNHEKIKNILDDIDLSYTDQIFNNKQYTNKPNMSVNTQIPTQRPREIDHNVYRYWQVNQEFVSNNNVSKLYLTKTQVKKILNTPIINKVYPEIESILNEYKPIDN